MLAVVVGVAAPVAKAEAARAAKVSAARALPTGHHSILSILSKSIVPCSVWIAPCLSSTSIEPWLRPSTICWPSISTVQPPPFTEPAGPPPRSISMTSVQLPPPPSTLLSPDTSPKRNRSFPASPYSASLPPLPSIVSLPWLPWITSSPAVPLKLSALLLPSRVTPATCWFSALPLLPWPECSLFSALLLPPELPGAS